MSDVLLAAVANAAVFSKRIQNGVQAKITDAPYTVLVGFPIFYGEQYCQGVIISRYSVLTSASCIDGHTVDVMTISYGSDS
ncbi:hypothetical protein BGX24_012403 [Mortierella sp. AD032]|nr:hypothetical protein BGX24_012403 [Mortierella sp. AD032]